MGIEKSPLSIVTVAGGVGPGRHSRAGAQCSLSRAVHRWGRAGQPVPVTAPCFLLRGCLPWPAEPRDSTRYDVRVELTVELADALG